MFRSPARLAILLLATAAGATSSHASSPGAWDEFRQEVQQKCAALAEGRIEQAKIVVDPFGTESYGVAILTGKAVGSNAQVSSICVYDKKTQSAEISGELPADQVMITVP